MPVLSARTAGLSLFAAFALAGCAPGIYENAPSATHLYVVRSGDTLYRISKQFGTTVAAIQAANHLSSTLIQVGATLMIPAGTKVAAPPVNSGEVSFGYVSWYGTKFEGRRTASGEVYNMNVFTAASPTLPFGTLVRVSRPKLGLSVVVRINDRGPFVKGRILDLSYAAAKAIEMVKHGTAWVRIEVLN